MGRSVTHDYPVARGSSLFALDQTEDDLDALTASIARASATYTSTKRCSLAPNSEFFLGSKRDDGNSEFAGDWQV